jgi:hypothetical protein
VDFRISLPLAKLILILNDDYGTHRINPTTQVRNLRGQQHDASMKTQQLPLEVPLTLSPAVLKRLLNNAIGFDQR